MSLTEPTHNNTRRPRKRGLSYYLGMIIVFILGGFILIYAVSKVSFSFFTKVDTVAIVPVEGTIVTSDETVRTLQKYAEDPEVKAIVLKVDSPGGAVGASQEIYGEVRRVIEEHKKPVVASFGNIAASGGYYVACAADEIITNPGSLTGSIGVIMELPNFQELIRKIGVQMEVVKSGEFKDIASPTRELTEKERHILESVINDVYDQFFEAVYSGRKVQIRAAVLKDLEQRTDDDTTTPTVTEEQVKQYLRNLADGRIFSGRQAVEHGLADQTGTLQDAINRVAARAGIEGKPHVKRPKKEFSVFDLVTSKLPSLKDFPISDTPRLEYLFTLR